ncbi:S9 family peptidase [bacterium]|nr:MAG: S9 family peptidase [bacterium]
MVYPHPMRRPAFLAFLAASSAVFAQQTLPEMPRYDRYTGIGRQAGTALVSGAIRPTWAEDGKSFTYNRQGKWYRFDLGTKMATETTAPAAGGGQTGRSRPGPSRGRQNATVVSPDGKRTANSTNRNIVVSEDGGKVSNVTTDGSEASRTKYGVASWVYGEELGVRDAMWWSPDSKRLAYYKFDEKEVKDYYLAVDQNAFQDTLYPEAYPKAGAKNPKVELRVWDGTNSTTVDVAFGDPSLAEYVYDVRWSPDGKELFFNRTNRKQNVMQFVAADPATGRCRVVAEEKQPQSWAENHPTVRFLGDNKRFVWSTEKNGYVNYELRNLDGKLLNPITTNSLDALDIVRIDEKAKELWYTAAGPQNPYFRQLHVVGLDGKNDRLLTDPTLGHAVTLAPDEKSFVDVAQSPTMPPETRVVDRNGKVLAIIATSDRSKFDELHLKPTEVFTYLAADGKTTLYGTIQFPSDFDPSKKYPVLLDVYGGPESGGINAGFSAAGANAELGFLLVNLAGRGTNGRGKAFRDAVYGKLGIVEIDDQAAGIKELAKRPYVDGSRVGVYGTSYGGYSTLMLLLRHPETFAAGAASSSVSDWRNYDSIYTERFMGLPWENENKAGYDAGSAIKLADRLKGRLKIYFGSSDDNVHPANTYQMVEALERAGKRYEMQVGTDRGHTGMNNTWMLEFFMRNLGLAK